MSFQMDYHHLYFLHFYLASRVVMSAAWKLKNTRGRVAAVAHTSISHQVSLSAHSRSCVDAPPSV
jgi:hypothetical protein